MLTDGSPRRGRAPQTSAGIPVRKTGSTLACHALIRASTGCRSCHPFIRANKDFPARLLVMLVASSVVTRGPVRVNLIETVLLQWRRLPRASELDFHR